MIYDEKDGTFKPAIPATAVAMEKEEKGTYAYVCVSCNIFLLCASISFIYTHTHTYTAITDTVPTSDTIPLWVKPPLVIWEAIKKKNKVIVCVYVCAYIYVRVFRGL